MKQAGVDCHSVSTLELTHLLTLPFVSPAAGAVRELVSGLLEKGEDTAPSDVVTA